MTNDPFHPGHLHSILIDANEVTSTQFMGYGILDGTKIPIMRLNYLNRNPEDVFDVDGHWMNK